MNTQIDQEPESVIIGLLQLSESDFPKVFLDTYENWDEMHFADAFDVYLECLRSTDSLAITKIMTRKINLAAGFELVDNKNFTRIIELNRSNSDYALELTVMINLLGHDYHSHRNVRDYLPNQEQKKLLSSHNNSYAGFLISDYHRTGNEESPWILSERDFDFDNLKQWSRLDRANQEKLVENWFVQNSTMLLVEDLVRHLIIEERFQFSEQLVTQLIDIDQPNIDFLLEHVHSCGFIFTDSQIELLSRRDNPYARRIVENHELQKSTVEAVMKSLSDGESSHEASILSEYVLVPPAPYRTPAGKFLRKFGIDIQPDLWKQLNQKAQDALIYFWLMNTYQSEYPSLINPYVGPRIWEFAHKNGYQLKGPQITKLIAVNSLEIDKFLFYASQDGTRLDRDQLLQLVNHANTYAQLVVRLNSGQNQNKAK